MAALRKDGVGRGTDRNENDDINIIAPLSGISLPHKKGSEECTEKKIENLSIFPCSLPIHLSTTLNNSLSIAPDSVSALKSTVPKGGLSAKEILKNPALARLLVLAAKKVMKQRKQVELDGI